MEKKTTEMYSIEKELTLLRPFVEKDPYLKGLRRYTEEEIQAVEKRLNFRLPAPIREVYQNMSDLLFGYRYLRPLELLHWEHGYLGFFESPEAEGIWGIRREDDPNALYSWIEESTEEEDECSFGDYYDLSELCIKNENRDNSQRKEAVQAYLNLMENTEYPVTEVEKLEDSKRYNCRLDAYSLFLCIHTLCQSREDLSHRKNTVPPVGVFMISEDMDFHDEQSMNKIIKNLGQMFTPLSEHSELLSDGTPILMAYVHRSKEALLMVQQETNWFILITNGPAAPAFIEEMENQLDLAFHAFP